MTAPNSLAPDSPSAENIAALLTPIGRGAVAVVAVRGPGSEAAVDIHFTPASGRRWRKNSANAVVYGVWRRTPLAPIGEDIVVSRSHDRAIEIHCHGGEAASASVLEALAAAGCRTVSSQKWLECLAEDPLEVEAALALASTPTRRTATILVDQLKGALRGALQELGTLLANGAAAAAAKEQDALLAWAPLGARLVEPWRVAVAGRPNVGKSSLTNAILGYQRAIVLDEPGTTRDVLSADTAINGWPVRLSDSAGLRESTCDIEQAGVALARGLLERADLVLWVIDAPSIPTWTPAAIRKLARQQILTELGAEAADQLPRIIIINKIDLARPDTAAPHQFSDFFDATPGAPAILLLSATQKIGLDKLLAAVAHALVPVLPPRGAPVPFTSRHFAALKNARKNLESGDAVQASAAIAMLFAGTARQRDAAG